LDSVSQCLLTGEPVPGEWRL